MNTNNIAADGDFESAPLLYSFFLTLDYVRVRTWFYPHISSEIPRREIVQKISLTTK
jgi:hypothetical protein